MSPGDALESWARPRREAVEATLLALFHDAWPPRLGEMCRYPLLTGGKRLRPLLTLAAWECVGGGEWSHLVPVAVAVELVHTYSLVHDDLPAMDDDDVRRGQPTVHRAYSEGDAVLVGDALLTEAFRVLATTDLPATARVALVAELADAAGYRGMIGGQSADIGAGGPVADLDTLVRLHQGKTGALIRCAVRLGALAANADPSTLGRLTRFGEAVGLAFQVVDDLLDLDEDAGEGGPPSFPRLIGVEATRLRAASLHGEAEAAVEGLQRAEALRLLAWFTVGRRH